MPYIFCSLMSIDNWYRQDHQLHIEDIHFHLSVTMPLEYEPIPYTVFDRPCLSSFLWESISMSSGLEETPLYAATTLQRA